MKHSISKRGEIREGKDGKFKLEGGEGKAQRGPNGALSNSNHKIQNISLYGAGKEGYGGQWGEGGWGGKRASSSRK